MMKTSEVLKQLEWQESEIGPRCPICKSYQTRGHREGCDLQEALVREAAPPACPVCHHAGHDGSGRECGVSGCPCQRVAAWAKPGPEARSLLDVCPPVG